MQKHNARPLIFAIPVAALVSFAAAGEVPVSTSASLEAPVPELVVLIYGFPGLSTWTLREAGAEAARLLRPVSVKFTWVNCNSSAPPPSCRPPLEPSALIVRILPNALPSATSSALGFATLSGDDPAAFIFYDRALALRTHARPMTSILGRAMAHEIAHLLLPPPGHANLGLMKGVWTADGLQVANAPWLGLSLHSIALMRESALQMTLRAHRGGALPGAGPRAM